MNDKESRFILGAGMTGLGAAWPSGFPVFEAEQSPGGICSSYYVRPGSSERLHSAPDDGEAYRFEVGGGHWIFGGDPAALRFLRSLTPMKSYDRISSVYFRSKDLYVPYALQNHLGYLGKEIASKALAEIATAPKTRPAVMADWLRESFGMTLTDLFFGPFHELYTAGLWTKVAPQDAYKSPVDLALAIRGAFDKTPPVGYNTTYLYPEHGLNAVAQKLAGRCDIRYGKRVARIDVKKKEISFEDGSGVKYQTVICTLPLTTTMSLAGVSVEYEPDPYTSVLVLNLGAVRGSKCPADHWIYNPDAVSKFHRVGFYSNVDPSFLPLSSRRGNDRVSIYVERAYPGGQKPSPQEIGRYCAEVVRELQDWGFTGKAEVVDPTWIDVAYTYAWPGSKWRGAALKKLQECDILMVGRYAQWTFQGISDSIRDGLFVGSTFLPGR